MELSIKLCEWRSETHQLLSSFSLKIILYSKHICDKFNTTLVEIPLAFPMYHSEILAKTEAVLAELNAVGGSPLQHGRKAKMVVIDSIASNPGWVNSVPRHRGGTLIMKTSNSSMVMPWEGVVDLCKKYGVLSLVDAAHSIGQLPVDLKKAGCDFWVSVSGWVAATWTT